MQNLKLDRGSLLSYPSMVYNGKERLLVYDYARVFVAILVIFGHLYTPSRDNVVRVLIYQFHMPFFFLISGMLYRNIGTPQVRKHIKNLLIPTVFFAVVFFIISGIFYYNGLFGYKESVPEEVLNRSSIFSTYYSYLLYSIKSILKGTAMLNGPCWFLIALFYCKVFVDYFEKNTMLMGSLFVILFLITCVLKKNYLFIGNAIMAIPIFLLGYKTKTQLLIIVLKHRLSIVLFAIVLIPIFAHYNGTVSMWSIKFGDHGILSVPCFYMVGLLGSLCMLSIASLFKKGSGFLVSVANSLISIVGLQVVLIFIIDNCWGYNLNYLLSAGISLVVLLFCWLSHLVLQNKCPKFIGR